MYMQLCKYVIHIFRAVIHEWLNASYIRGASVGMNGAARGEFSDTKRFVYVPNRLDNAVYKNVTLHLQFASQRTVRTNDASKASIRATVTRSLETD